VEVEVCLLRRERGRARKGFEFIYTRRLVVGKGKGYVISSQDCGTEWPILCTSLRWSIRGNYDYAILYDNSGALHPVSVCPRDDSDVLLCAAHCAWPPVSKNLPLACQIASYSTWSKRRFCRNLTLAKFRNCCAPIVPRRFG
jgi:hypothetical protein